MNWDDSRFLAATLRRGSFAGAARELGCEHTTVSRRIESLESALGATLFLRTPEGLMPTPAATQLKPLVEQVGHAIRAIERRVAGADESVSGVVKLTAPEAFVGLVLSHLLELEARHPELVLEVKAEDRTLDLTRAEADLALRASPTQQPDLLVKKLSDVGGTLYASAEYLARRGVPSPVQQLSGHHIVGYDDNLAQSPGARWLSAHGAGARVVFRGSTLLSVLGAVAAGLGVSVLPCFVAAREPRLQRVSPEILCSGTLSLVVHADLAAVARVRAVMNFIEEVIARQRPSLAGA